MTIYIVIRPQIDFDFCFSGSFKSREEATKCAKDKAHTYEGTVYEIKESNIMDKYIPEDEEEKQELPVLKLRRDEMISKVIQHEIEYMNSNPEGLKHNFYSGFKGYINYSDEELIKHVEHIEGNEVRAEMLPPLITYRVRASQLCVDSVEFTCKDRNELDKLVENYMFEDSPDPGCWEITDIDEVTSR